jgi:arginine/lysine/ornithine decarboxylase
MIHQFLIEHAKRNTVSFHMPGHKGAGIYSRYQYDEFLDRIMDCDITEIPGADNLFQTEGVIRETQLKYASLYNVDYSYLLINGTSGGLIAAILASVAPDKKLIMARNCHKAVFNALTLGNIQPVYAYPERVPGQEIAGAIPAGEIRRLLAENPDADAVILPSPNYYGICSDIKAIAGVVHQAGKILIVDQAHGAHLHLFHKYGAGVDMPLSAESCGADIVVNSTHKTLASFTQSAVLNLNSNRVDRYHLEDKLQAIQSTSPSYLLMGSLDINAELLINHGKALMEEWKENLDEFYRQAAHIAGLAIMQAYELDRTKINLDMSRLGLSGAELERELNNKDIFPELFTGNLLMCMTGIGNTKEHMERLLRALSDIARINRNRLDEGERDASEKTAAQSKVMQPNLPPLAEFVGVTRTKQYIPLAEAENQICAGSVIPYPPGIPLICPGEVFSAEIVQYIQFLRKTGEKVIGITDQGTVQVGK